MPDVIATFKDYLSDFESDLEKDFFKKFMEQVLKHLVHRRAPPFPFPHAVPHPSAPG
jgi:hypothetical protein